MTTNTLAHYGHSFQNKLVYLLLEDRIFSDRCIEILKPEFFEFKYLQWFSEKIFEYKKKYKTHPTKETFESIIKSTNIDNVLLQKQISDYYSSFNQLALAEDKEFVKAESLDFSRKQRLHEGILQAAQLLKTNSFDEIKSVIDNALKAGAEIEPGHDYLKDFEKRYVDNVRFPISTGWDKLDEITSGGIGRGEYSIIMGASGSGKTKLMTYMAAAALKKGHNVVFYTLELKPEIIGKWFDACLTGIPFDELKDHKAEVLEKVKDVKGNLIIKFYPKKSASIITIRNHLSKIKSQGFNPDLVVLDYLDLLKSVGQRKELRHEIGETYDEFEALNQELNTAGITGSQLNKIGFQADVVDMSHMSEAFNKNFGSYLTLGLTRSNDDKVNNTAKLSVCKNRNGPDGIVFNLFMDPANVDIKILDLYDPNLAKLEMVDVEEEKRRLKAKYQKFKANGVISGVKP